MSITYFLSVFEYEEDLLQMVRDLRKKEYRIKDVYTPYPVHGLDEALGLPPSKLPWGTFIFGALACTAALFFQTWVMTVDWPINIGGKPMFAWQSYIPVSFEFTVLCAGVGTVLLFLFRRKLYPKKNSAFPTLGSTHNHFVVAVQKTNTLFDEKEAVALCKKNHAVHTEDYIEDTP